MKKQLKIFIIAGEVSGDVLGARVMREMKGVNFVGIGGENMQSVGGFKSLFPMSDLAVMGLVEVLKNARTLTRRINETTIAIEREKPDIVLTIDSPGFAKRVIKKSRITNHESRFYHIVAPQVWAWGEKRAEKYAKIFDKLYAFFDFEKPYFEKYGLKTISVGHPIADGLRPSRDQRPETRNITLIPGSRISEVKKLMPLYKCISNELSGMKFFIPTVETTREYIENEIKDWCVKPTLINASERYKLFEKTDLAIAASGTVSAELAIMHVPAIIVYKMNKITEFLARRLLKIKWVSLVNILLKKSVYPELLGRDANTGNIINAVKKLMPIGARKKMVEKLSRADKMWNKNKSAAKIIADDIIKGNI